MFTHLRTTQIRTAQIRTSQIGTKQMHINQSSIHQIRTIREARKQNLSIGLYSQSLNDFPKEIVDIATNIYVLGAGSAQAAKDIADRFGLSAAAEMIIRRISKPTKAGANFVGLFRTTFGESNLYLTNCTGAYAKWAFSTTSEDMRVRNKLYELFGCSKALQLLVLEYPDGSIKPEAERRQTVRELSAGEIGTDILEEIIEEYAYKEAINKTFVGVTEQIKTLKDDAVAEDIRVQLVKLIILANADNPGRYITGYNDSENPIFQLVSSLSDIGPSLSVNTSIENNTQTVVNEKKENTKEAG